MKTRIRKPVEVKVHKTARDFLAAARSVIATKPDIHHHMRQIAMMVDINSEFFDPPYGFWTIGNANRVKACALHVKPDGLVLSDIANETVTVLWEAIAEFSHRPVRIVCDPVNTDEIADAHRDLFNIRLMHQKTWTVGRLDAVKENRKLREGRIRIGGIEDKSLVEEWADQYSKERPAFLDVADFMRKKLKEGELYIFDDGVPRAMATVSGRTKDGVRISSVFTSLSSRGRGYASTVVTRLSNSLLAEGHRFVVITWKTGDEVGNLYRQIGFDTICYRQSLIEE